MTTTDATLKRRNRRGGEWRVTVNVGTALRARLRKMAADANKSDSALVLDLIREGLSAREKKPNKTPAEPARENESRTWKMITMPDLQAALAAAEQRVRVTIDASAPPSRHRRRRRRPLCCTHRR